MLLVFISWLLIVADTATLPSSTRGVPSYPTTSNRLDLRRSAVRQPSSHYLHAHLQRRNQEIYGGHQKGFSGLVFNGLSYLASVDIGEQCFKLIVDTGSSDTWVAADNFSCVNIQPPHLPVGESVCNFSSTYTIDDNWTPVRDQNFNISYQSGQFLSGILGTVSFRVAGIEILRQEIALATTAGWVGDGINSGVLGLAYPDLTSAFSGTDSSKDEKCTDGQINPACNAVTYSSIINTMFFVENLTVPVFAMAISRDESRSGNGGVLTFGGVPGAGDPGVNATGGAETYALIEKLGLGDRFSYYPITVDGVVYPGTTQGRSGGGGQYIIDSGTSLNYFPKRQAEAINKLFDPPATLEDGSGYYIVDCNAAAPEVGLEVNGVVLWHNPKDLIVYVNEERSVCVSGVQSSGEGDGVVNFLGEVFLKNVLVVLKQRMEYVS